MSKGSKQRPHDKAAFDEGYERAFKRSKREAKTPKELFNEIVNDEAKKHLDSDQLRGAKSPQQMLDEIAKHCEERNKKLQLDFTSALLPSLIAILMPCPSARKEAVKGIIGHLVSLGHGLETVEYFASEFLDSAESFQNLEVNNKTKH